MFKSDPFSEFVDDDKTVIRPTPGGRRRRATAILPVQPLALGQRERDLHEVEL